MKLQLDFNIITSKERTEYVNNYLEDHPELEHNAVALENLANYILWGEADPNGPLKTDPGESVVDAGYVNIASRNSPWSRKSDQSLEAMSEIEGAQPEIQYSLYSGLHGQTTPKPEYIQRKRPPFSRKVTRTALLQRNLLDILKEYEELWTRIDEYEFMVSHWEIVSGKRKTVKEIRAALLKRLPPERLAELRSRAEAFTPYEGLKMKRELVRLRTRQYELKDLWSPTILNSPFYRAASEASPTCGNEEILPLGGCLSAKPDLIFYGQITSAHFERPNQDRILRRLMYFDSIATTHTKAFDFRVGANIAELVYSIQDVHDNCLLPDLEQREYFLSLYNTFLYYLSLANLLDYQVEVLVLKAQGRSNAEIAATINKQYGKSYRSNYISTIFREQCCKRIAKAAILHYRIIENLLCGKEEFKKCSVCGEIKMRDSEFYLKRKSNPDGFANRCRICDQVLREAKAAQSRAKE